MPRNAHVLVVDDDEGIRELVTRVLTQEGHEVVAVGDGIAALQAVLTATQAYDLVVTNNRMPRMGGPELVARLRLDNPAIPIIHLDDLSRPDAPPLPADIPNLPKPFDLDRLKGELRRLLADGA